MPASSACTQIPPRVLHFSAIHFYRIHGGPDLLNNLNKSSVYEASPFFPGFRTPASSYQYSLMSTRNRPLNTLTFTKRLLEICKLVTKYQALQSSIQHTSIISSSESAVAVAASALLVFFVFSYSRDKCHICI